MKKIITLFLVLGMVFYSHMQSNAQDNCTVISQIGGGTSSASDIDNGILVYSMGQTLIVSDFNTPSSAKKLGEYKFNDVIVEVRVKGNYAYVVTGKESGDFFILDITDPKNIKETATYYLGEFAIDWFDEIPLFSMLLEGNYAYLSMYDYLVFLDLSDKTSIKLAGEYVNNEMLFDGALAVKDGYLLAGISHINGGSLATFNVSDKGNVSLVNMDDALRGFAEGISISGNIAYLAEGEYGISTHDISDITKPVQLDTMYYYAWLNDIVVHNNMAYATLYSGGVYVVDVSDPNNLPETLTDYHYSPMPYSFTTAISISGNYMYLSSGLSGLEVLNISTPGSMSVVSVESVSLGGRSTDACYRDDYLYIANGGAGLTIADVSDLQSPSAVGFFSTPGYAYAVELDGDYAYVGHGNGLSIYNVADPRNAEFVGEYLYENSSGHTVYGVEVKYPNAFLAYGNSGVVVMDVSNPAAPTITNRLFPEQPGSNPQDVHFIGDYLYVSERNDGGGFSDNLGAISVIDFSDLENPTYVDYETFGSHDKWNYTTSFAQKGDYLFLGDETGTYLFDVSNPADPVFVDKAFGGTSNDIAIAGNYLYAAKGGKMMYYDITDPTSSSKVGEFKSLDYIYGVEAYENVCFVSDCDAGVHVIANSDYVVGVKQETIAGLSVYPNPVVDKVRITADSKLKSVEVFNNVGQIVYSELSVNSDALEINVENWESGFYVVKVSNINNETQSIKVIK